MNLLEVTNTAINPALALLPKAMDSAKARVMLLAIGLQESRFEHRHQIGGPAHSFWQFESGGGVKGVMTHPATAKHAKSLCDARGIPFVRALVFEAMENDDVLAAGMARLLLWSDAQALPAITNSEAAWALYLRTWRPGKPHRNTWDGLHARACGFVMAQASA